MELNTVQLICVAIIPVLFAVTVHEVAHGFVANKLGDPTALMLGRLTLNPIKHIDLVGTIIVPATLLLFGGIIFGWAKPVPVSPDNFRHQQRDMAIVAIAGPLSNLLMAVMWMFIFKLGFMLQFSSPSLAVPVQYMARIGIQVNIIMMVLNLFPIPPLDGSKVLMALLPGPVAYKLSKVEPYGFFIVLALIMTGVFGAIAFPVYHWFVSIMSVLL